MLGAIIQEQDNHYYVYLKEENDIQTVSVIQTNKNTTKCLTEEEAKEDNITQIIIKDDKVYFPYGIDGYYDAREDTLHMNNTENYECIRSITETEWGDKIIYSCHYKEENVE